MDVTLSSSAVIPYLDRGYIEEYANLNFYSDKGELVKMNLVVLAALRSSLALALTDADFEDCCVLRDIWSTNRNYACMILEGPFLKYCMQCLTLNFECLSGYMN